MDGGYSSGAIGGDPAPFEVPGPLVGRWQLGGRPVPWHLADDWRAVNERFPDTDSVGDASQREVRLPGLADVVFAAHRDGRRYALSLLAGCAGAAYDGYTPNGVVFCSLMRNAVIRIRQGNT